MVARVLVAGGWESPSWTSTGRRVEVLDHCIAHLELIAPERPRVALLGDTRKLGGRGFLELGGDPCVALSLTLSETFIWELLVDPICFSSTDSD